MGAMGFPFLLSLKTPKLCQQVANYNKDSRTLAVSVHSMVTSFGQRIVIGFR